MEVKRSILNYLIENNRPYSKDELATIFETDSFLVGQILDELESELKVKQKNDKFMYADYRIGTLIVTDKGKSYIISGTKKIWISTSKLNGASKGDIVLVDIIRQSSNGCDGEVICVKEHVKEIQEGVIVNINSDLLIKDDKNPIYIQVNNDYSLGQRVVYRKGKLIRDNIYKGEVVGVIGDVNDPIIDIKNSLAKYNIQVPFSYETTEEVKKLPTEVSEDELNGRVDLRNEEIFTIDGDDAKDLDDAVSLTILNNGNYLVRVSIADVSHYVKQGSNIDKDAYSRGTSVYPPGCVVPMLPHELSSGICSLFSNVDRLAQTCEIELDKNGNVVNYSIYESVINSKKRMTYNNVNKILAGENIVDYLPFKKTLIEMQKLKEILNKKRCNNGSLQFETKHTRVEIDENGKTSNVYKEERGEAERIIEEFMLLANVTVSKHLTKTGFPSVYRIHENPDMMKISNIVNIMRTNGEKIGKITDTSPKSIKKILDAISCSPNKETYIKLLLYTMSKAKYSTQNKGHYGLAFEDYTHFTSPIRRYPDLMVHRLIKEYNSKTIDQAFVKEQRNYLEMATIHASYKEHSADKCERETVKVRMAKYIEDHMDTDFKAVVTEFSSRGMTVELYNGIIGLISYKDLPNNNYDSKRMCLKTPIKIYRLGDVLEVTPVSTNVLKGEIRFKEKVLTK